MLVVCEWARVYCLCAHCSVGSDQELHADAAEGCGVLPHPLHHAQGEAAH